MIFNDAATYIPAVVTLASVVSAVLPAPKPGSFGSFILGFINLLAINVGHAANATPKDLKTEFNNTSLEALKMAVKTSSEE